MSAADGRPFFTRVESIRGLGALAVAGYHMSGAPLDGASLLPHVPWDGVSELQNTLGRLAIALFPGHAAVMAFFVISGFVLRVSLAYGPQRVPAASAKFLLARVFRIFPVVFLGVTLTAAFPWARAGSHADALTPAEFAANLFLLDTSLNGAYWALQLELLMAPVIVALYFLERWLGTLALVALAAVTTGLSFAPHWAGWPPLSTNLFAFVLGTAVPTVGRRFASGTSPCAAAAWAVGSLVVLLLIGQLLGTYSRWTSLVEAYAAVLFISLVSYRSDLFLSRCLDVRLFRLLGRCSGSYYVLHMATVLPALAVAREVVPPEWRAAAPAAVGLLVVVAWLAALAPLMLASYHLVEAPGIALGRRLGRAVGLEPRRTTAPVEEAPARRLAA